MHKNVINYRREDKGKILDMNKKSGFTLLEIIVVAALISLLSGIAVISIRTLYERAQINTTRAEVGQISKALSFAHQDTGIFPKFHVLEQPVTVLEDEDIFPPEALENIHYIGMDLRQADMRRILERWNGPYWGVSVRRNNPPVNVGPDGLIGTDEDEIPYNFLLPIDPFGNPYVLYLLTYDPDHELSDEHGVRPIQSPSEDPDFMCAVVSYGPSGLPGGDPDIERLDNSTETRYQETFESYRAVLDEESDDIVISF